MEIENEELLVLWFKRNYKTFGFDSIIKQNQRSVPDFLMSKEDRDIKVEIEVNSSNFLKHKHKLSDVDVVICFRKDIDLPIQIIELRDLISSKELKICKDNLRYSQKCDEFFNNGMYKYLINLSHKDRDEIQRIRDYFWDLSLTNQEKFNKAYEIANKRFNEIIKRDLEEHNPFDLDEKSSKKEENNL